MGLERIARIDAPDTSEGSFGTATKLYGNTLIVSSYTSGITTLQQGYVYIYQRGNDGNWTLKQSIRGTDVCTLPATDVVNFGGQVDIYENYAAISSVPDGGSGDEGQVHILVRGNDAIWRLQQTLEGDSPDDNFGFGLSLSGNNLLVGAPAGENGFGAAYWFVRGNDGIYNRVRKITGPANGSQFGGIALSISGNSAIVPAGGFNATGRIYFYARDNNGDWEETATIDGTDQTPGLGGTGAYIYKNFAVAGTAQGNPGGLTDAGAFVTFTRDNSGTWSVKDTIFGTVENQNLGNTVGLYGNYVTSISRINPEDTANEAMFQLYRRNAEGNLDLLYSEGIDTATTPIIGGADTSDIHGNYFALGCPDVSELLIYQNKN